MEQVRTTCSLCEACCAGVMDIEGGRVVRVRPDPADALSGGFICAKGASIPEYEADPNRLQQPLLRRNGHLEPATWEEAFDFIEGRLPGILSEHGRNAVAVYVGNGAGRSTGLRYISELAMALGTTNFYTSGTIDQIPLYGVNALIYGDHYSVAVPDLDRCQLLWIMGANPAESNGSMLTAPGIVGRLQKIQARGGRVVVFDPRRTATAKRASEHFAIRPASDAAFLAAVAHVILREGAIPSHVLDLCGDISALSAMLAPFTPERMAPVCDIDADTIERLALEMRVSPASAVYGRMGTTVQHFSSLTCWLMAVINILSGNLDAVGGAMFTKPLYAQTNTTGIPGSGAGAQMGRWHSRVRGAPEMMGELPVVCLPEEMETEGEGQVRGLFVVGANPVLSNADPDRMTRLLGKLDLLVSLDIYVNETGLLADVILPSPPRLTRGHYDNYFYQFSVRNYGRYTKPYRPLAGMERSERDFILRLAGIARGEGWNIDIDAADEASLRQEVLHEVSKAGSKIEGRDPDEIMAALRRLDPEVRRFDLAFRIGPYGDAFGASEGITFEAVRDAPAGLDLGPLKPRMPEMLRTKSGTIELMQPFVEDELARLERWMAQDRARFVLVGRRQLRQLNSAMHNLPALVHKTRLCALGMNAEDACEIGVVAGDRVRVSTARGAIEVDMEIVEIARGVVSLPHGWGRQSLKDHQPVAAATPGVNVNILTDPEELDPLTGTLQVYGIPVDIAKIDGR